MTSDPLDMALNEWREDARVLERCGYRVHAEDIRRRIEQIRDARQRSDDLWLSTEAASVWSGYSEDHLRTLAQEGAVAAEKRRSAWYFLRSALPKKARARKALPYNLRPAERAARRALKGRRS